MIKQTGIEVCFGVRPEYSTLPIVNLPPDTIKVRRRIRNTAPAMAYVKTPTEIQKWVLAPDTAGLKLAILQGVNASHNV